MFNLEETCKVKGEFCKETHLNFYFFCYFCKVVISKVFWWAKNDHRVSPLQIGLISAMSGFFIFIYSPYRL